MHRYWKAALALAAAASLIAATACGDDENDTSGDATAAPTTAASASPTAAAGTTYPATVTDMLGRSVEIPAEPVSIAAISPTAVEFVYAVGETSKTRTKSVSFPAEAMSAKDIGSAYQPSLELIAGEAPDLIVADSVLQPQLKNDLEALNVPVLYVGASAFGDVPRSFRIIGEALNTPKGEEMATALEDQAADIEAKIPATKSKVLIVNGTPDDFFAALPESYVGDLARLAGADNLAAGQPSNAPFPGYTKLSLETIVASAPEVVLAITAAPGQTISEGLAANPAWADVPAVKNQRIHEIDAQIFLQAPGPRAAEGLLTLAKLLYPEVFGQ
ncbi:MAG: ABC transporter substrate-binding protein [Chloroflexi bacterium]|nr:ABC transporter substrate-binding protein [Chloroflexota bacterium]